MTLKLYDNLTTYSLAFNVPNLTGQWYLLLKSQLSNSYFEIDPVALTLVSTNDRYTEFTFEFPEGLPKEHKNGIYRYDLSDNSNIHSGLLKVICDTGGTMGTVSYISNNEDQEASVYYRPQY